LGAQVRRHLLSALGAAAFVLAGSTDWELVPAGICAKDEASCELALRQIEAGGMWRELKAIPQHCRPHPGCFSPESEVIRGYNDK
jgi:hypothetical protein